MKKFSIKVLFTTILILLITYVFFLVQVVTSFNKYVPEKADAIVILGYALENGETPSDWLVERLDVGLNLYNNGYSNKIIVTGGKGPSDNTAVSLSMRNWLIEQGVLENDILFEDKSKTTYENFVFVKNICEENNLNSITVVTNDFHMYRSMKIADEFFYEYYGKESSIDFGFKKMISILREPISLYKYYFIDKDSSQ